jgi:hypothetical protein
MKSTMIALVATVMLAPAPSASIVNFDSLTAGAPPAGWLATRTGSGDAKWTIEADATAPSRPNVLKQSGQATFPVCIKNESSLKDGFVEVKFKPVAGKEDQAGGLIWRAKDSNNYYIARANALEDNVTIHRTVGGQRQGNNRKSVKVALNQWHTLRVDFQGTHFSVTLDGKRVIEWDDSSFTEAGNVGVWTKADSLTLFDDFTYGPVNQQGGARENPGLP